MDTTESSATNASTRSSNDTTLTVKHEPGVDADASTASASASASSRTPAKATAKRGKGRGRGRGQASASQRAQRQPDGDGGIGDDAFVARLLERNWLHRSDGEVSL